MASGCTDDRDCIIRTVYAEGGASASPVERAAITHVIMNRLHTGAAGGYADSVPGVLFQKDAFEPWGLRRNNPNHPLRISASDPAYADVAKTVDGVLSGSIPDPTGGADRFQQPETVADRIRQGKVSSKVELAPNNALRIGQQAFWSSKRPQKTAGKPVSESDYADLISGQPGPTQVAGDAVPTGPKKVAEADYQDLITGGPPPPPPPKVPEPEPEPDLSAGAGIITKGWQKAPGPTAAIGASLPLAFAATVGAPVFWPLAKMIAPYAGVGEAVRGGEDIFNLIKWAGSKLP
jgi:Cell Wall Hydrolase